MAARRSIAAFTLVEVMLALGVFAIAVIGMIAALDGVLTAAGEARDAQMVRSRLEDRLAVLEAAEPTEISRKVELDEPRVTITESMRPERILNAKREILDHVWRITVTAEWTASGQKQQEETSILRYAP